ncbi:DUF2163 domain-containing protein [Paracoccus tegillarcae]|uniref:Bacteriophage phiJL001 Gp84 C-terminal domain-containing protein n=1 Tax=Paracoccus tegillarcae TaxID=1529068 RepID=A0A2K9ETK3_9RHOB|nr:DUF2163 domain-containing protein [Paracoccus tegillarcae]AUH34166.1 hypothetical protein CUV01_12865 [Paracoccus tegillarcae]
MSVTTLARAWAISRKDGLELGFTDHDQALSFEGIRFRPDSGMTARAVVQGTGLSVDNTEAEGALTDDAITEADLMAGRWDSAELRMWEVDWTDVASRRMIFRGSLGEVSRAGGAFRAELRGLSEPLNQSRGRRYHPRCSAVLGDADCGVDLLDPKLSAEAVVEVVGEDGRLTLAQLGEFTSGWFERGTIEVISGRAVGMAAQIKNDLTLPGGARVLDLWAALAEIPVPGDRVRVTAGCDKHSSTCRGKFNNFLNFRGFPHLPSEDWLLSPDKARREPDVKLSVGWNQSRNRFGGGAENE